jgi:hypothetical protein
MKLKLYTNKILQNLNFKTKNKQKLLNIRYKWFIPLYKRRKFLKNYYDFKSIYGANRIIQWLIFKFIVEKPEWEKIKEQKLRERQKLQEKRVKRYWANEFMYRRQ